MPLESAEDQHHLTVAEGYARLGLFLDANAERPGDSPIANSRQFDTEAPAVGPSPKDKEGPVRPTGAGRVADSPAKVPPQGGDMVTPRLRHAFKLDGKFRLIALEDEDLKPLWDSLGEERAEMDSQYGRASVSKRFILPVVISPERTQQCGNVSYRSGKAPTAQMNCRS